MSTGPKPFGWEVVVECCDRIMKIPDGKYSLKHTLYYRGSKSTARGRAMSKPHAFRIVSIEPVTEEQWLRCKGKPWERGL